jgi:hypothetical protein
MLCMCPRDTHSRIGRGRIASPVVESGPDWLRSDSPESSLPLSIDYFVKYVTFA